MHQGTMAAGRYLPSSLISYLQVSSDSLRLWLNFEYIKQRCFLYLEKFAQVTKKENISIMMP